MAGRMEFDADVAEPDLLAIGDRLRAACKILPIAQPHHVERLLGGQYRAMAGAGVIGMAMGDQGPLHGADRIDVKAAGLAAETGGSWQQEVLRTHFCHIGWAKLFYESPPGSHA